MGRRRALEQAAGEAAGEDRGGQDGSMRKRRRLLGAVCLVLMCSVLSCNVMWGLNSQPPRAHSRRIRRGSPCSYLNFVCATTSPLAATSSAQRFARLGAELDIASHHRVHYFKFASSSRSLELQPLGNPMFLP